MDIIVCIKQVPDIAEIAKVKTDPETGTISWTIEYTPLKGVDNAIDNAYEYKKVLRKYPDDQKLEKLFDIFAAFKKQFRMHVTRKYGNNG